MTRRAEGELPVRRVAAAELRRIFNEGRYEERVARGELLATVNSERPAPPRARQPDGTVSRTLWYWGVVPPDGLVKVAFVHEYRLPDGGRGGSGLADPKRVVLESEILIC